MRIVSLAAVALIAASLGSANANVAGAIFTTTETGSRVNANHYAAKEDVYLDGGPGTNAPAAAAALPAGDYYFQVTDPSGRVLLSQDAVAQRRFTVSAAGVIVSAIHPTGIDRDHAELGALTVRLFPYADTPNPGGVYKVWATPVDRFVGDVTLVDNPGSFHGFVPAWSKTDTYKVRRRAPTCSTSATIVRKFSDANGDGVWGKGEKEVTGWRVWVTDPLGVTNLHATPFTLETAVAGVYTFREDTFGTLPTGTYVDGQVVGLVPCARPTIDVLVGGGCGETHTVTFGNRFDDCGCR
jgi:hypothetical protein